MPPRRPRPSGLTNLGSTCYFNSVVQALYAMHAVTDALASQHPNDLVFAVELATVFAQMGSLTDFRPVDTQALFSLLKVRDGPRDKFANPQVQEDAAECLQHVLAMTGFVSLAEMRSFDTTTCSGCRVASSVPGEASMLETFRPLRCSLSEAAPRKHPRPVPLRSVLNMTKCTSPTRTRTLTAHTHHHHHQGSTPPTPQVRSGKARCEALRAPGGSSLVAH